MSNFLLAKVYQVYIIKSPIRINSVFSLLRFLRRVPKDSVLKVEKFIDGCL